MEWNKNKETKEKKKKEKELLEVYKQRFDEFKTCQDDIELKCSPDLKKHQRKELHKYAINCGLKPTYRKSGNFIIAIKFFQTIGMKKNTMIQ